VVEAVRKRLQFSLLGVFAATTIAALGISLYLTRSHLHALEAEVRRLRKETGHLSVEDTNKVHVIAVPGAGAMTWRWRVYLPGGHNFGVYANCGKLDSAGYPEQGRLSVRSRIGGQSDPNKPREILLDTVFGKTPEGDPCLWIRENGQGYACIRFGASLPSWLDAPTMFSERTAGQGDVVTADATVPIGLIALDGVGSKGETSEDAVLIWIGRYEDGEASLQSLRGNGLLP
jgi:hypothetical protein